ncbi:cytochrome P450 [Aspergillus avenaceus]|uniref:Cytochrome P450 n=1 Tax=Aspergillus avenaceus TaxID=36643 RepID=A0A5N6U5V1_ASPAV|nr:cytochrome P450 [Aspergillus avenaceus]
MIIMGPDSLLLRLACTLIVVFYLVKKINRALTVRQFKQTHGCLPPASEPRKDPILSLDALPGILHAARHDGILNYLQAAYCRNGSTFLSSFLGSNDIFTIDPENIKTMLAVKFTDFELGEKRRAAFHPLLGNGIFSTDGAQWEHSRALLRPSFTRTQISSTEFHERHVQSLIRNIPRDGSTVDLQTLFFSMTLETSIDLLVGETVDSQHSASDDFAEFAKHISHAQRMISLILTFGVLSKLHCGSGFKKSIRVVRGFIGKYVRKAIQNRTSLDAEKQQRERYVFLHELVQDTCDEARLTDELLSILIAGRDTTAGLLSMLFYELAQRPEVWERLQTEVGTLEGQLPSFEQLKQLKYLSWVINETLRLHPIVPSNIRTATRDTVLPVGGGPDGKAPVFVSKGQNVVYTVYAMHRRQDLYGPDADEFRPERWATIRPGWAFLPFNGGPRICLGQQYALTLTSYTTVRILQTFKSISNRDPGPWKEWLGLTMASKNGIKVSLVPK